MQSPQGKISGCHNWIQVYSEERKGRLNYQGYVRPKQARSQFPLLSGGAFVATGR